MARLTERRLPPGRCRVSGHTPGPWTVTKHTNSPRDGGETLYSINGPDESGVVEIGMDRDYGSYEAGIPLEADALLIAAAPDLLKALILVRAALASANYEIDEVDREALEAAEAAIAKAEGK